jgi:hypothetical protein
MSCAPWATGASIPVKRLVERSDGGEITQDAEVGSSCVRQHSTVYATPGGATPRARNTSEQQSSLRRPCEQTGILIVKVVSAESILLAGYVFFASLPDLRRYIRISRM